MLLKSHFNWVCLSTFFFALASPLKASDVVYIDIFNNSGLGIRDLGLCYNKVFKKQADPKINGLEAFLVSGVGIQRLALGQIEKSEINDIFDILC